MRAHPSFPHRFRLALAAVLAIGARPVLAAASEPSAAGPVADAGDAIPPEWLDREITVEQAEAAHPGITDDRIRRFPEAARPFGFENPRWEALKGKMRPGDVLWSFASSSDSWMNLAGRSGIALVRDGRVVDALVTVMN